MRTVLVGPSVDAGYPTVPPSELGGAERGLGCTQQAASDAALGRGLWSMHCDLVCGPRCCPGRSSSPATTYGAFDGSRRARGRMRPNSPSGTSGDTTTGVAVVPLLPRATSERLRWARWRLFAAVNSPWLRFPVVVSLGGVHLLVGRWFASGVSDSA